MENKNLWMTLRGDEKYHEQSALYSLQRDEDIFCSDVFHLDVKIDNGANKCFYIVASVSHSRVSIASHDCEQLRFRARTMRRV